MKSAMVHGVAVHIITVPFPVARVASFPHWFAVPGSRLPWNRFKLA